MWLNSMKFFYLMIFLILVPLSLFADLTEESFKNKNRYDILENQNIAETDSINVEIKFIPPAGKKVNMATFVRTWEKMKHQWMEIETVEVGNLPFEFSDNILLHNILLKNKNSVIALEIDFIHCDKKGGSCSSKKYLTKILRTKKTKDNKLNLTLKA